MKRYSFHVPGIMLALLMLAALLALFFSPASGQDTENDAGAQSGVAKPANLALLA